MENAALKGAFRHHNVLPAKLTSILNACSLLFRHLPTDHLTLTYLLAPLSGGLVPVRYTLYPNSFERAHDHLRRQLRLSEHATPLEMWKQHAVLVQAEADLLTADLWRARMNLIKLADQHAQTVAERDTLKVQLEKKTWELSKANVELSALKNSINGRPFR
jgi:hypothetical protein